MKNNSENTQYLTSPLRGEVGASRRVRGKVSTIANARALRRNQTDTETKFWNLIRNRQLGGYKFVRQLPIGNFIVDFTCRQEMLIVELDGGQHVNSTSDDARTRFLNAHGYSVLRFWNNEILNNSTGCCETLLLTLQGAPSHDLRFAPATLSPTRRGKEGSRP